MVAQATCPDSDVIHDLLCGVLPEHEHAELSLHFDLCTECRQRFEAEASDPEFLGDAARLCAGSTWQQETATLQRLMRDIPQQLSSAADAASVASWSANAVADFLEPSDNAEHIGRLGSHEIVEVIGRGGMGVVLRGIDTRLNRAVAIKVLAPELASNPNARRRFFREGQAAAAVSHDHVVTIHAVEDSERLPYLVMEFVAGESLEECVRRTGPLSVESILRMGRQMALGLAAAHEVGLVHRDMKPANILLENGIQRVRITDFGLARAVDDVSITQSGVVSGTPLYMSPEQASGETIDHRSDLFSLGSVLYTMCTGRPAFRAQTTMAVLKRVCEDSPRPIREVNPDIPEWLVEIVDRLIARQPDDRIQSASEVADLLGGHLAHLQDPNNVAAPVTVGAAQSNVQPRSTRLLLLIALLLGISTLGVTEASGVTRLSEFLGIVLKLKTSEGTLVIEIEDPNVKVSVDGDEVVIDGVGVHELRLKPGKHQFTTERNGNPASQEWVTIERGGKKVLRILQLPPEKDPNQSVGGKDTPTNTTQGDLGSHARQGDGDNQHRPSVDGVAFETNVRLQRFGNQSVVVAPGVGKLIFPSVPEQLFGQRCATSELERGGLTFKVYDRSFDGAAIHFVPRNRSSTRQRLWLLMPEANWGEGAADDGFEYDTRQSLAKSNWHAWRTLTSYQATEDPEDEANHVKWEVFYVDANPNDSFTIRTHPSHAPMLVWGSILMDDLLIDLQWDQRVSVFKPGASVSVGNGHHIFDEVPPFLAGRLYTKRNGYQGIVHFHVERDQRVVVGMYDWRAMNDGNASGGWKEELTPPDALKKMGWEEVATLQPTHTHRSGSATWHFYARECKRGDTFKLRGHKYQAPIVFGESADITQLPAPEPRPQSTPAAPANSDTKRPLSPIDDARPSSEFIRLDPSRIRTQIAPTVDEPVIYGINGVIAPIRDFPVYYHARVNGRHGDGHLQLIGQIRGHLRPGERIQVERFERRANRVRIVFGHFIGPEAQKVRESKPSATSQADSRRDAQKLTATYEKWLAEHPDHEDGSKYLLAFARHLIRQADQATKPEDATATRVRAREHVRTARKLFQSDFATSEARMKSFPVFVERQKDPKQSVQRNKAQIAFITAQFDLATCTLVAALAHAPESEGRVQNLTAAATEFEQLHAKYRSQLGGLFGRLWQGRCLQLLGAHRAAMGIFDELLQHPGESGSMRSLRNHTVHFRIISLNDDSRRDWQLVLEESRRWMGGTTEAERNSSIGFGVTWEMSRALLGASGDRTAAGRMLGSFGVKRAGDVRAQLKALALDMQKKLRDKRPALEMVFGGLAGGKNPATSVAKVDHPSQSLYFQVRLPSLPPGEYHVEASLRSLLPTKDPLEPDENPPVSVSGTFSVPGSDATARPLKLLAARAIMMHPVPDEATGLSIVTQRPTGLDLAPLLASSGQKAAATSFPKDHVKFEGHCGQLAKDGNHWALCAALDHSNVDAKIYAARQLAAIADPNTVAVLLAAAKRNNYGVNGSENATLHSVYRSTLKRALEAATALKLTPKGLKFQTSRNGESVTVTSDANPELFVECVTFERVEDWLRHVYLADGSDGAQPITAVDDAETGLIGRVEVDGRDGGILFHYRHAKLFVHEDVPEFIHDSKGFTVTLEGYVVVPRDMLVQVWQAGGGVSHDNNWLHLDGTQLCVTGDDRDKHYKAELPLLKGLHHVRWELTGGTFRANILFFMDPESGELLRLVNKGESSIRRSPDDTRIEIKGEKLDWPIKTEWLPRFIQKLNGLGEPEEEAAATPPCSASKAGASPAAKVAGTAAAVASPPKSPAEAIKPVADLAERRAPAPSLA
jgi:serine/threonine protein kinase